MARPLITASHREMFLISSNADLTQGVELRSRGNMVFVPTPFGTFGMGAPTKTSTVGCEPWISIAPTFRSSRSTTLLMMRLNVLQQHRPNFRVHIWARRLSGMSVRAGYNLNGG